MATVLRKTFTSASQSHGRIAPLDVVSLEGRRFWKVALRPGYRWSADEKPGWRTETCMRRHVFFVLAGRLGISRPDGSSLEFNADDLGYADAGHDAWVIGDEDCVLIEQVGGKGMQFPLTRKSFSRPDYVSDDGMRKKEYVAIGGLEFTRITMKPEWRGDGTEGAKRNKDPKTMRHLFHVLSGRVSFTNSGVEETFEAGQLGYIDTDLPMTVVGGSEAVLIEQRDILPPKISHVLPWYMGRTLLRKLEALFKGR